MRAGGRLLFLLAGLALAACIPEPIELVAASGAGAGGAGAGGAGAAGAGGTAAGTSCAAVTPAACSEDGTSVARCLDGVIAPEECPAGCAIGDAGAFCRCETGAARCAGDADRVPEACSASHVWEPTGPACGGATSCVVVTGTALCAECTEGATRCTGNAVENCLGRRWVSSEPCARFCDAADGIPKCVACLGAGDCALEPDQSAECGVPSCDLGKCVVVAKGGSTQLADDVAGDCKHPVCNGAFQRVLEPLDTDDLSSPCATCKGGALEPRPKNTPVGNETSNSLCSGTDSGFGGIRSCAAPATASLCDSVGTSCCQAQRIKAGSVTTPSSASPWLIANDFFLDRYEVTQSRFRAFLADYESWRAAGNPKPGAGFDPDYFQTPPGAPGAKCTGWRASWDAKLPATAAALFTSVPFRVGFDPAPVTGTGPLEIHPDKMAAAVSHWYAAQAFCLWDGGTLPTYGQWWRAAAGDGKRPTPWGVASITGDAAIGSGSPPGISKLWRTVCPASSNDTGWPALNKGCSEAVALPFFAGGLNFASRSTAGYLDVSPEGVFDLFGNQREWMLDDHTAGTAGKFVALTGHNRGLGSSCRTASFVTLQDGGLFYSPNVDSTKGSDYIGTEVGFRCARSIHGAVPPPPTCDYVTE